MTGSIKFFAVGAFVAIVIVLLALLLSISFLLELFLILVGILVIVGGSLVIAGETDKIIDFRHRRQIQREFRELELQSARYHQILLDVRYRRESKRRHLH